MLQPRGSRRQFLRGTTAGASTVMGLGLGLEPARAAARRVKLEGARDVPSVCPYCAVGCGQIVSVRDGQILNIEGNPDSPISGGTLCPKGSATFQLAVNPNRLTKVKYRAPYSTRWEEKPLGWAMDRIAERLKAVRDADFTSSWSGKDQMGRAINDRTVNHCSTIASLGGATMDNEWNYAHLKLWRALGGIWIENQARI